jgi:uncharacterized protein (DUF2147 family)
MPKGLWRSAEEGFVLRLEPCGNNQLCGFAAGAPPKRSAEDQKKACGQQMLHHFTWNESKAMWEGKMRRPDSNSMLNATLTANGAASLTLRGKLLFFSKTLQLTPFQGKIGANCQIE